VSLSERGHPPPPAAKQAVCAAASDKPSLLQRRQACCSSPNHGPPLPLARMTPNVNPEVGLPRSGSGNQLSSAVASNLPCLQHRAMHETKPARSYDSPPHDAQRRDLARFSPASFHMQTPHAVMILARQFEPAAIATTLGSFHLGQTWPVCLESSIKLPVSQELPRLCLMSAACISSSWRGRHPETPEYIVTSNAMPPEASTEKTSPTTPQGVVDSCLPTRMAPTNGPRC